jgi:triosephosphate isomerase
MNPAPKGFAEKDSVYHGKNIVVFPSFIDVAACVSTGLVTGGQWGWPEETGARTGDVSMKMLQNAGCTYVLCGHSERRKFYAERDEDVAAQVTAALNLGLIPIVCIGETAEEKTEGQMKSVLERQLTVIPKDTKVIIAYEPVWAIGTGNVPSVSDIQEAASVIAEAFGKNMILYGGSLDDKNAKEILSVPGIGGSLIGGASLKPEKMATIVAIAEELR